MDNSSQVIKELRNTLGKIELAMGAVHDAIVWTSGQGIIQWCNNAFDRLVGRPHIEIIGQPIGRILPLKPADDGQLNLKSPWNMLSGNKEGIQGTYTFQDAGTEKTLEVIGNAIYLSDQAQSIVYTIHDLTLLKKNEQAIFQAKQELEQKVAERTLALTEITNTYRAILDTAVDAIITIDEQAQIRSFNPASEKIFGYGAAEVLGENVCMLMPSPHREKHDQYVQSYLASGNARVIGVGREVTGIRKDGTVFPIELAVSKVSLPDRTVFAGIIRDITLRKETEASLQRAKEEAEKANQAKSDFLARMSHEIRTPINVILGMTELGQDTPISEEQKKYLSIISDAGENLLHLVNDVLDIARAESSGLTIAPSVFNLKEMMARVTRMMETHAARKGLSFTCTMHHDLPECVKGDESRLQQILNNLLYNSIKFTETGEIRVEVSAVDTDSTQVPCRELDLQFSVSDTGIGIPKEAQQSIFDKFTQANTETSRRYGGSGLGLAICKVLVSLMEGRIWVESTPSRGCTFYFTARFTLSDTGSPVADEKADPPALIPPVKILLIDDSPDNELLVRLFLSKEGHQVESATDGKSGLELFQTMTFDLVLLDMQMPVMDGYKAARAMRNWEEQNNKIPMPILALTAHAHPGDKEKCIAAGCSEYLAKPFSRQQLFAAVTRLLKDRPLAEEGPDNAPEHPEVTIDPDIAELLPGYLANRKNDLQQIEKALARNDYETIGRIAHSIKGSGGSYGLNSLTTAARDLEKSASAQNLQSVQSAFNNLQQKIREIEELL